MKKIFCVLILFLAFSLSFAQGWGKPRSLPLNVLPFLTTNDTLINADTLASNELDIGNFVGAINLGLQFHKVSGTSAVVNVYYQMGLSSLNYGVPWDSVAVSMTYGGYKMIRVATIDSTNVKNEVPIYINLSSKSWWNFHDRSRIILLTGSHTGKISVIASIRGQ